MVGITSACDSSDQFINQPKFELKRKFFILPFIGFPAGIIPGIIPYAGEQ